MLTISLQKDIRPGTWRYLGLRCPNINPGKIPIAGDTPENIGKEIGGKCYRVGKVETRNAFLVIKDCARFLYINPRYSRYRKVAQRVFSTVPWDVDFDHALAKRIALHATPQFKYVLLIRIPPGVNRQHGHYEKKDQLLGEAPDLCFPDYRILDKWLGRPPKSRNREKRILDGYSPKNATSIGLTLKQRGRWAYAIGMGDNDVAMDFLSEI